MPLRLAIIALLATASLQADQRPTQSNPAPEQLTVATQPPLRLIIPLWIEPPPTRIGVLTLVPPERRGEMIQMSLPVGDLAMRAARTLGQAQRRRAEEKARKDVAQTIKDFQIQQSR